MKTFPALRRGFARQRGAAAIEFALVAGVGGFLMLLIGIMEMGRVLFYLNTASEVTRLGARIAVVCAPDATTKTAIVARMRTMLPLLDAQNVNVSYMPSGCDAGSCRYATVNINSGVVINTFIPFAPVSVNLPAFQTTLPRESLLSTDNALCTAPAPT